jgi:hypothetical protein
MVYLPSLLAFGSCVVVIAAGAARLGSRCPSVEALDCSTLMLPITIKMMGQLWLKRSARTLSSSSSKPTVTMIAGISMEFMRQRTQGQNRFWK